jgi:hypothetical protein
VESMGHATPVFTSVSPSPFSRAAILLGPFPKWPAFPASQYYGPSAPSRPDRQAMRPPEPCTAGGGGRPGEPERFPRSSANPSTGSAPSYAPAPSPRLRRRPSPWPPRPATSPSRGVPRRPRGSSGARCDPTHVHQVSGRRLCLEERSATGSSRMPVRLASRARPIWQY